MEKYITREGLEKLKKELDYLKNVKRKEISKKLETCLSFGDLSENSEYFEAKEAQGFLEGRILELEEVVRNAIVVPESKQKSDLAQIGSTILVNIGQKKEKFKIVGAEEANPLEGKISVNSPLGEALLNKEKGAIIEVNAPEGKTRYKILKIN
ncbi:MAG: transcription elongation factor GreA [Candidatus Nealsonbacteria bacterium]